MSVEVMTEEEVDAFLRESDAGVLSLTDGRDTYAVPESFGYDGETVYFQFVYHGDSRKMAYLETTEIATLTVFSGDLTRSAVVRGVIRPVPEDDRILATNAIAENASVTSLDVSPEVPVEDLSFEYYRLDPREVSGRKFDTLGGSPGT